MILLIIKKKNNKVKILYINFKKSINYFYIFLKIDIILKIY